MAVTGVDPGNHVLGGGPDSAGILYLIEHSNSRCDLLCESILFVKNPTFYSLVSTNTFRSYGRQFLQVKRPNQQRQALKEVLRHI